MVTLINPRHISRYKPRAVWPMLITVTSIAFLGACSRPLAKTDDTRPVRVIHLAANNLGVTAEFSGEVRARIESKLGFRVGGKIVSRKVDLGTVVKRGQVLMQLDPQDLQLAQMQAYAGLQAAASNRALAQAELSRYQDLRAKNFVSQAVLDAKVSVYKSAQASYDQALAASKNQANQTSYTTLISDVEGVVTGVDAEIGQVVAAGSPVVRVAQMGEKEIVIGIPEDKVDAVRSMTDVSVHVWANPKDAIPGKIRELSPIADPATRTYAAKVSIPNAPASVKLGMTANVIFSAKALHTQIKVPLTALFQEKTTTAVWVVDNGAVRLVPVQMGGVSGNEVLLTGGVSAGQTVVTAGVNLLKPGQKVKILDDDLSAKTSSLSNTNLANTNIANTNLANTNLATANLAGIK